MTRSRYLLLAAVFATAVCVKTLPYLLGALELTNIRQFAGFLWNFSPITALFLFCGARVSDRRWAFGVPLASMLVSDILIAVMMGEVTEGLLPGIPAVYGSYALIVGSGSLLRSLEKSCQQSSRQRLPAAALLSAAAALTGLGGELVFFLTTNFVFWLSQTEFYPHTWQGLVDCYVLAVPFFKHALISTPVYSMVLFGTAAFAHSRQPALASATPESALAA